MKSMNYNEFRDMYGDTDYNNVISTKPRNYGHLDIAEVKWMVGGAWGGSCYGGEPGNYCPDPSDEPSTWTLDCIIEDLWPDISLNDYRKKVLPLVSSDTSRSYEYYGNHTDYAIKRIKLIEVFTLLLDNGKISG